LPVQLRKFGNLRYKLSAARGNQRMSTLHDKVALVTGAGRAGGIGAAVAKRLAQAGADVVIGDLCAPPPAGLPTPAIGQWEELQAIAADVEALGGRCLPAKVDITAAASIQAMLAEAMAAFGRIDILVNNAGAIFGPAPVAQMADEAWRRTLEVNATGTFLVAKAVLPAMIQAGRGGRVINMSSLATLRPRPFMAAYAASKAAVAALTQSLAQEVAQFGITVNAVLPGDIDTGMKQWGYQLEAAVMQRSYEDVVAAGVARIPAGRLGVPEDVAGLVAYLASDEASFITGQLIPVTGGRELT
jgi:meso-butanediol dehydrogenase/(S,S)-butanediol dehydrogenase/diacetyl reductase